jgi:hypothetical protein
VTARQRAAPAGRVRVGLLLHSLVVPAWVWAAIRDITTSDDAEVVVAAIIVGPDEARRGKAAGGGTARALRETLHRVDEMLERRIPADQDAFVRRDAQQLLVGVPVVPVNRLRSAALRFAAVDVADLKARNLDVLLWFGDRSRPRGQILHVARAGTWSLHLGDPGSRRGGPAGFWEVHERRPVTGAALEILVGDPDRTEILGRTSTATVLTSLKRTRNALIWTALPLLGRALGQLRREGVTRFLERVARENDSPSFYSNPRYRSPGVIDLLVHGARRGARLADLVARQRISRQQWILYYGLADDLVQACWRLRPLAPPIDRFWADPHVLQLGSRYYVFVEEMLYARGRGRISVIEIDEDGRSGEARTVLEEPHHLSYPFVFEHDGDVYMVPESAERGTVDLYRATAFPDRWTFVEHLMTGLDAYDATLLLEHDRWWLFASVIKYPGAGSGELNLYSSDRLIGGDWRLHPASPLSSLVTGSRPAGAVLRRNGRLYRPAQDGSGRYGRAIKLYEIREVTEDTYREELVSSIEPAWNRRITRTHTLAHAGRLTVLDALWSRSRLTIPTRGREEAPTATDDQARRSLSASS